MQHTPDKTAVFNRSWDAYKVGFEGRFPRIPTFPNSGGLHTYWIGNDKLNQLTKSGRYGAFKFEGESLHTGKWHEAVYRSFVVENETNNYLMHVGEYLRGDAGDALRYHNNSMFTTYDRDNDDDHHSNLNCARYTGVGFWYKHCNRLGLMRYYIWHGIHKKPLVIRRSMMHLLCTS